MKKSFRYFAKTAKKLKSVKTITKGLLIKNGFGKGQNMTITAYITISLANNQLATVDYTIRAAEEYKKSATEWIAECQAEIDQWEYQLAHWDDD